MQKEDVLKNLEKNKRSYKIKKFLVVLIILVFIAIIIFLQIADIYYSSLIV